MEDEFQISIALIIFLADAFYWFLTVFLIDNVVGNKSVKAGLVALLLNCSSQLAVFYFVRNFNYMIPASVGAFLGAVLATEYDRRRQKNQKDEVTKLKAELIELREEFEKFKQKQEGKRESITKKVVRFS